MNFISTKQMTGSETKKLRRCIRCGEEPKLVGTMLDSNKARIIRMFRCQMRRANLDSTDPLSYC
jgi:hypothetical protein